MDNERITDLRSKIYASLDAPNSLEKVLDTLIDATGASGAFVNIIGLTKDDFIFGDSISRGANVDFAATAEREVGEPDPWSKAYLDRHGTEVGHVYLGTELCSQRELNQSVWADKLRELQVSDVMMATIHVEVGKEKRRFPASLGFHYYGTELHFTSIHKALVSSVIEDVRRVANVDFSSRHSDIGHHILGSAMAALPEAVVIVDEYRNLVFSNLRAQEAYLLARQKSEPEVRWKTARVSRQVDSLLDQSFASDRETFAILKSERATPFLVEVHPVRLKPEQISNYDRQHRLVVIRDPLQSSSVRPEGLARVYDLTRSEGEVAVLMFQGMNKSEIAAKRGVSPQTVRTQIKMVYQKLGVSSRAQFNTKVRAFVSTF